MNSNQESLDEKFLQSKQAGIKLDIALERYFQLGEENLTLKKRYKSYLSVRLRPAACMLIKRGENRKLMSLLEENSITLSMLDTFLLEAGKCGSKEAQILLLKKKAEMQGFQEESWEL